MPRWVTSTLRFFRDVLEDAIGTVIVIFFAIVLLYFRPR